MTFLSKLYYSVNKALHTLSEKGISYTLIYGVRYSAQKTRSKIRRIGLKLIPDPYCLKLIYRWNTIGVKSTVVTDPFRRLTVDPDKIVYCSSHNGSIKWTNIGKIKGGDWDQTGKKFTDSNIYNLLKKRFEKGYDWNDIHFIQDCLQNKIHWSGATTQEEIYRRCNQMDDLFVSIREDGYQANCQINKSNKWEKKEFDEVVVDIGRNGELLFVDGRHRLSIAKILDLDTIPVQISCRHKQWAKFRNHVIMELDSTHDGMARFNLPHPEFQDIPVKYSEERIHSIINEHVTTNYVIHYRPDIGLDILANLSKNGYNCIAVEPEKMRRNLLRKFKKISDTNITITDNLSNVDEKYSILCDETHKTNCLDHLRLEPTDIYNEIQIPFIDSTIRLIKIDQERNA